MKLLLISKWPGYGLARWVESQELKTAFALMPARSGPHLALVSLSFCLEGNDVVPLPCDFCLPTSPTLTGGLGRAGTCAGSARGWVPGAQARAGQ